MLRPCILAFVHSCVIRSLWPAFKLTVYKMLTLLPLKNFELEVQFVRFRQKISPLFRFSFLNRVNQCNIASCLTVFTFICEAKIQISSTEPIVGSFEHK